MWDEGGISIAHMILLVDVDVAAVQEGEGIAAGIRATQVGAHFVT